MRDKKGAAHFEMIIGFVFFIGFVMFLFMFLSPWDNSSLPNSALAGLYTSFYENVETELSSVFVDASSVPDAGGHCFYIELPADIFEYVDPGERSLVRKLGGVGIDSDLSGRRLNLDSGADFFRVALSPEFIDEEVSGCGEFPQYELGSVVEMKVVSWSKLAVMKKRYDDFYNELKSDLNLAEIFDFAIVFEGLPEMSMEPSVEISSAIDILAKEYVVKVLRSNGAISNERISIRVW